MSITLNSGIELIDFTVLTSSGYEILDAAVEDAVRTAVNTARSDNANLKEGVHHLVLKMPVAFRIVK